MRKNQRPVLIFDVMSLVSLLCAPTEEILCGGRHQMFSRILDQLFATLSVDAELVFFQDGQIADTKFDTWRKRQNEKYKKNLRILDKVYDKEPLERIANERVYTKTMMTAIEESCKAYGTLYYAVKSECDHELARFAYSNSCVMAVFSNDTDFLIFPGNWRYFSSVDLNLETLKTKEFNRVALHATLKLNNQKLAILGTIAGNDFVPLEELRKFHDSLRCTNNSKFHVLAKFITNNFKDRLDQEKTLAILSQTIFKSTGRNLYDVLKSSIEFYNMQNEPSLESPNPLSIHLLQHNLFIYQLLNKSPTNLSLVFFDCREDDMPQYFDLMVPLVQRQAGVVLMHSPCDFPCLTVYSKANHKSEYDKFVFLPIWPPFKVPTLVQLLSEDPEFDESRFDLLKWIVGWETLKCFDLSKIPSRYLIDVLTLVFLLQRSVISLKEANLILWTIKNAEEKTIIRNIQPPEFLDHRAFRVAFMYVKSFANVARSIEVCGLKKRYWVSYSLVFICANFNSTFPSETVQLRRSFLSSRVQRVQEPLLRRLPASHRAVKF